MAEKQPPKTGPENSFLKTAVAAVPAVTAAGIATRRMLNTGVVGTKVEPSIRKTLLGQVLDKRPIPSPPTAAEHIAWMKQQMLHGSKFGALPGAFYGEAGADIAKQAWTQAMGASDPITRERLLSFTQGLQGLRGREVFTAIEQTLRQNESDLMNRTFWRFQNNAMAIRQHHFITGVLPTIAPVAAMIPSGLHLFSRVRRMPTLA